MQVERITHDVDHDGNQIVNASFLGLASEDAGTADLLEMSEYTRESTGTAAVGFGIGHEWKLDDDAGALVNAANMQVLWRDPTAALPKAAIAFRTANLQGSDLIVFNHTDDAVLLVNVPINSSGSPDERGILLRGQAGTSDFGASIYIFGTNEEGSASISGVRYRSSQHQFYGEGTGTESTAVRINSALHIQDATGANLAFARWTDGDSAAVSGVDSGSIRYDKVTDKLQFSQNTGGWTAFDSVGGGVFSGSLAATQVAFGTGVDAIGGEAAFTYNSTTNILSVEKVHTTVIGDKDSVAVGVGAVNTGWFVNGGGDMHASHTGTDALEIFKDGGGFTSLRSVSLGSVTNPAWGYTMDSNTGTRLTGTSSDDVGHVGGGVDRMIVFSGAIPAAETGGIQVRDGLVTEVSVGFINDVGLGMFRPADNTIGWAVSGVELLRLNVAGLTMLVTGDQFLGQDGTATTPTFSSVNFSTTGLYVNSGGALKLARAGLDQMTISAAGFTFASAILGKTGTGTAAGLKFSADADSGIERTAVDEIKAVAGGLAGLTVKETASAVLVALYDVTPVVQHTSTGQTAGSTIGTGNNVNDDSTFTGGSGTKAYTIGDMALMLKNLGVAAVS